MYLEIPQGSKTNVQGLDCWIPPEGYVYNIVTKQLERREIYKRSEVKADQYWERIPLPPWYKAVLKEEDQYEKKKKEGDPPFHNERYEEFKRQEWDRRLNGFWFMNNGEAVYLTGSHYMFLQWWQIDIGYPKFRLPDLEYFYFLQYCIEDPDCMGMVEVTKRRFGKTFRAGLFLTEYVTRTKMTNAGIQSKTGNDAKKLFAKAVVNPFKKLPRFFRPEYDMSLGITPKTEMRFQQTNVRGKKAEENIDKDELGSMIDWQSADTTAYDGTKLHRYVADESGKTTEVNVYDRHEVVRYCLLDDEGRIIGKALYTTTVEKLDSDKEGVQEAFKLLWDESNQNRRQENGRTSSGLYRFFMSADRARNFDIYGAPNVEKTIREILADRESVKNNPRALSARIRKEARTIGEAFHIDGEKSIFNPVNIENRHSFLTENPIPLRKILFERTLDGHVRWRDVDKRDGDFYWEVTPDFNLTRNEKSVVYKDGMKAPGCANEGAISIDSYSNSQGGRKYGSKASAFYGDRKLFKATAHLYGRPNEKDQLHQQVMLMAEFKGVKAYYEHTADDYEGYFRERGMIRFLGRYPLILIDPITIKKAGEKGPDRFYGTPITPYSLTKQNDNGVAYFEHHANLIDFTIILEKAPKYDPYDRTVSDVIVSFLILISVLMEPIRKPPPKKEPLVTVYDNPYYGGR